MTTARAATPVRRPAPGVGPAALGLLVTAGSLLLGGVTFWAQGVLPAAWSSFADSASGWTLCTALLVAAVRPGLGWGALLGAVSFVALVLGYSVAAHLRGLFYDPVPWGVVGLVAGPFVGAAAAAVAGAGSRTHAALGSGLLAGILAGDGVYGLTVLVGLTSRVYWTAAIMAGGLLLLLTAVRLRTAGLTALQLATCAALIGVMRFGLPSL